MRHFIVVIGLLLAALGAASCDGDGDGADALSPTPAAVATAAPTPDTTPAIVLDAPTAGSSVQVPLTISGTANVFEAVFHLQVLAPNGALLCARRMMASSGTGTPADWETAIAFAFPSAVAGPLPVRIRAFSLSAKDGAEENIVERQVNVSPEPPSIVINDPPCGVSVSKRAGLDVAGTADVFEAALTLELHDDAGRIVVTQNILSAEGQTRAPFAALLDLSDPAIIPGAYDLVALSFSARDGSRENEFAIPIVVTP